MAEDKIIPPFKMIIIGGSAGSLEVILKLFEGVNVLSAAAVMIVMHRKTSYDSPLVSLLSDRAKFPVKEAEEKEKILAGNIYLAPGDYHLLVEKNFTFSLDDSEKINYSRPSIDVSFESAAEVFGSSLTGILLSGANSDGVVGLEKIKQYGGFNIVQDPSTAEVPFMPQQAILHSKVDVIADLETMVKYINNL